MTSAANSIRPMKNDVASRHDGQPARVNPKSLISWSDACEASTGSPAAASSTSQVLVSHTALSDQLWLSNPTIGRGQRKQNPSCLPVACGLLEQRI
jgi:hypothetical protein